MKTKENKELIIYSCVISFIIAFMFCLYEPFITYAQNINDFWFDLNLLFPKIIIFFFATFLIIFLSSLFLLLLFNKNKKIYKICLIAVFVVFLVLYIQGNYFINKLPVLNGSVIDYSKFNLENIKTLIVFLTVVIIEIILVKRFSINKTIKINNYINIAVFSMLLVSLISTFLTTDIFKKKNIVSATTNNINTISNNKNMFIIIADSVDSRIFKSVLDSNKEFSNTFDDFTYYPDTTSGYMFTRDSIPFILSGIWNEEKVDFVDYYVNSFDNSKLFKLLDKKGYHKNFYEYEIYSSSKVIDSFENVQLYSNSINGISLFKQFVKYDMFKYLPFILKKYSKIETADFNLCKNKNDSTYYSWSNSDVYQNLVNNETLNTIDGNYFQILHFEGGHVPFDNDENVNIIDKGTYEQKVTSTIKIIDAFIKRLKNNNSFDNSIIYIMADHGEGKDNYRQNPMLLIKGINEKHKLEISNDAVSYLDLIDTYEILLNNGLTKDLFKNIPKNRDRRVLNNLYTESRMIEWIQSGKAWDLNTFNKTGVEFHR